MADYIDVTALNRLARQVLAQCEPLNNLIVCGEISNFTRHYKSGHLYFTLKDANASVKAVMFRDKARLLNFEPQNGMMVLVYGNATLYERDGAFQVYADYMRPFGAGAAQMAFDALKKKLEAEDLFAPEHKRSLPVMPRCIGIVTSKTGAALKDVCQVMGRRWPLAKLMLAPVSVQGLEAESSILDGIRALDARKEVELILVTRGGGSKEDLWVFNSERIARAAYACHKPVVSAVGHEIDYTILDYVADLRAPTPSAAAELCVPDQNRIRSEIYSFKQNIQNSIQSAWQMCYNRLSTARPEQAMRIQRSALGAKKQKTDDCSEQITRTAQNALALKQSALGASAGLASSLNPYAVLSRGYAMIMDEAAVGIPVRELHPGQNITLKGDGARAHCTVNAVDSDGEDRNEKSSKIL